jgi:rhodanese-related sulfurtransferase
MKILNKILIISTAVLLVNCGIDNSKKYVLSPEETLDAYINNNDILSPEKLSNIILCKKDTELYQFIDLRTPHDYIENHVKDAINIPAKDILDEKYINILNQDKKINILYCKSNCNAITSYLMLKQLNFKNIKVALGGFEFVNNYIIEVYGIKTGVYNDEKPRFDFLRLVAGTNAPVKTTIDKPNVIDKNPNKVIKDFDEECPDLN